MIFSICFVSFPDCGPPARQDANYGKNCPGGHNSCINNNQGISTVAQAWEQCGKVAQCAFVMRYVNNLYYLRRATDPNLVYPGIWGYNYKKCRKYTYFHKGSAISKGGYQCGVIHFLRVWWCGDEIFYNLFSGHEKFWDNLGYVMSFLWSNLTPYRKPNFAFLNCKWLKT